jgi:hypothetical protein
VIRMGNIVLDVLVHVVVYMGGAHAAGRV